MPVALLPSLPPVSVVIVLLVLSFLAFSISRRAVACYLAGMLLGAALGIFHGIVLLERRPGVDCELEVVQLDGTVSSLPAKTTVRDGEIRQRFEFRIDRIEPSYCAGARTILLSYYGDMPIKPGQRWRFHSRLKRPWGLANPGSFNMQSWYAQTGIDAVGSVRQAGVVRLEEHSGYAYLHHRVRQLVSERIALLPVTLESRAILRALTVADKSGIDTQLWRLFQQYGLNHLLVISGLHVGLVAGFGFFLGAGLGRLALLAGFHRLIAFTPGLLALLFAALYAAMAGFSLSTLRALTMLSAFVLASLLGRRSGSWNNLLLAAFLVLLLNPLGALGSGFWLSFGAVGWLLWLAQWQPGGGLFKRLIYTHICMSLLMIPLGGWWFGGASPIAAIANLFMVPLVGMFVVPLALLGVGLQVQLPGLGNSLLWLAAQPLELLIPVARVIARDSGHIIFIYFSPSLAGVLLAVVGLVLLPVQPRLRTVVLAVAVTVPLLMPRARSWEDDRYLAKFTVLDVGQGTSVVIEDADNVLVYDTGGGDPVGSNMAQSVVMPYLRQQGISSLDTLVISHADNDHSAGVDVLLANYPVRQYIHSGEMPGAPAGHPCRAGSAWRWPSGISFQLLSSAAGRGLSSNNTSCVLQVDVAGQRLLLPGDIDSAREKALVRYWGPILSSNWLLAAHHGSITSTSLLWLKFVQPSQVIFSSGYANGFGHPHPGVVERIMGQGIETYSTSEGGALEVYLGHHGVSEVQAYRASHRRYWY